ncbi:MAG: hypothetical protein R3B70_01585 [Polyangiaceae bacterium]
MRRRSADLARKIHEAIARRAETAAKSPVWLLVVGAAVGCGARSELWVGEAHGGAGGGITTSDTTTGSTPDTTTNSTSETTTPTPTAVVCTSRVVSGAPLTPLKSDVHLSRPSIAPATEDQKLAVITFARTLVTPGGPQGLRQTLLAPWIAWPAELDIVTDLSDLGGEGFRSAQPMPPEQAGGSLLFYVPTGQFPSDMHFVPGVKPKTYAQPYPKGVSWDAWEPAWPSSLTRGTTGHLAAYGLIKQGVSLLDLAFIDAGSLKVKVTPQVACGGAPLAAATVAVNGGFLIASAVSGSFDACAGPSPASGPANRVELLRYDEETGAISAGALFEEPDPIAHVALAARGDGAYVVWQSDGATALAPPPVRAVLVDGKGNAVGPVFEVTGDGANSDPFAAVTMGNELAVARFDRGATTRVQVDLFDGVGAPIGTAGFELGAAQPFEPSFAMQASLDGSHAVVAWSDIAGAGPATVHVARVSCAEP